MASRGLLRDNSFELSELTNFNGNNTADDGGDATKTVGQTNNSDEALANSTSVTRSDGEFARFIMARMFSSGVQVWWLMGILVVLFLFSTITMFFGSLLDTKYLFASNEIVSVDSIRRLNEYENLQDQLRLDYPQLERLSNMVAARHALGDPLIA